MGFEYDYNELSEEILFNRYCGGDTKAFNTLLNRMKNLVYSLILRYVKTAAVADEVFQDVFTKVCRNKDQFRHATSFKSWLATITKNTCIDLIRKNHRELKVSPLDSQNEGETDRTLAEKVADETPSPFELVNFKFENKELEATLDELPLNQRETFYLKVIMEMTFEEIGEAMGCSTNTAKSRYRYALSTLRGLIKRKQLVEKAS